MNLGGPPPQSTKKKFGLFLPEGVFQMDDFVEKVSSTPLHFSRPDIMSGYIYTHFFTLSL